MAKIGIIDDWVNPKYLSEKWKVRYIFTEGADKESREQSEELLTHATVIAKILEEQTKDYEIINFVLTRRMEEPVDIRRLQSALELCLKEEVDILCMSLGTIRMSERNYMYPQIRTLYKRGVILIAAADNEGCYMMPAAMEEVIGVDVALGEPRRPGEYYFCGENLWRIDFQADCRFQIQLDGKEICPCTSYAVPVIAARVNNLLNQGFWGQAEIRKQLERYAAGRIRIKRDMEEGKGEISLPVVGSCELEEKEWISFIEMMQSKFGVDAAGLQAGKKIKDGRFLRTGGQTRENWKEMLWQIECYTAAELVLAVLPKEKEWCDILIRKTEQGSYQCIVPETKEEVYKEELEKVCKWIIDILS